MRRQNIGFHFLLWAGLYAMWVLLFQGRAFAFSRTLTVQFCYLLFIAGNFYFNTLIIIPRFLYKQRYVLFIGCFMAGIAAGALLRVPLALYLNKHYFNPGGSQPAVSDLFFNSLINIFIWVVSLVAGKLIIDRIRFQRYVANMENEKSKTELDFLKAQFNPHFLFNSINSIYSHIDKKNVGARNMLLTFSEMLRYQLYDCNVETIPIDKELSYIRNYIALQQTRKEESLVVRLEVGEDIRGFTIAPLLFTAFIENCFKYVSDDEGRENKVEISLKKVNDLLEFRAYNTRDTGRVSPLNHKGIGIANVKRRLELLYPGRYDLTIQQQERSHEVLLKLQLA